MLALINRLSYARILVVEDNLVMQEVITSALAKAGFCKIETAIDGIEALAKTQSFEPDLVLLDLKMPNLDGFGYCERVRNDHTLLRMPIIVQTTLDDRASRLRALSCGADDFLNKPIDVEELNLRVCSHLIRYFAYKEMQDMYSYINMELDHLRQKMRGEHMTAPTESLQNTLKKHCEVLESMTTISSVLN